MQEPPFQDMPPERLNVSQSALRSLSGGQVIVTQSAIQRLLAAQADIRQSSVGSVKGERVSIDGPGGFRSWAVKCRWREGASDCW